MESEALLGCAAGRVEDWWPLLALAGLLLAARLGWARRRLARVGDPVPRLGSLRALLRDGAYAGVPVREEEGRPPGEGGRWVPGAGEIRVPAGLLDRADVDALAILDHERGHAAFDLPAPRGYRWLVAAVFVAGLALAAGGGPSRALGTSMMGAAFALAAVHTLRNEAVASEYAWRQVSVRGWPPRLRRQAATRLVAALVLYLSDWSLAASAVVALAALLGCR